MKSTINIFLLAILAISCSSDAWDVTKGIAVDMHAEEVKIMHRYEKIVGEQSTKSLEIEVINLDSLMQRYPEWVQYSRAASLYFQATGDSGLTDYHMVTVKITERNGTSFFNTTSSNSRTFSTGNIKLADSVYKHCIEMIDASNGEDGMKAYKMDFDTSTGFNDSTLTLFDTAYAINTARHGPVTSYSIGGFRTGTLDNGTECFEVLVFQRRNQGTEHYVITYEVESGLIIAINLNNDLDD